LAFKESFNLLKIYFIVYYFIFCCSISLYHNVEKIPSTEHIVVQEYLERPFLIDDFKCDLRIYVLVSSCDPLKIFLFNDGLVRMGTEKYKDPSPQNLVNFSSFSQTILYSLRLYCILSDYIVFSQTICILSDYIIFSQTILYSLSLCIHCMLLE